jgi:hypothetical protein
MAKGQQQHGAALRTHMMSDMKIRPGLLKSQVNVFLSFGLIAVVGFYAVTLVDHAAGVPDPIAEALASTDLLD